MQSVLQSVQPPAGAATQLRGIDAQIDQLLAEADRTTDPGGVLSEVERLRRRLDAVRLRLLARAEQVQVAAADGSPSTAAWVARRTLLPPAQAARDAALADRLSVDPPGGARPASATRAALETGTVSVEHARVIADALGRLPLRLRDEQRAACEQRLVADALRYDPQQLRRHARRVLAEVEPDPEVVDAHEDALVVEEEDRAYAAASLTLHDNGDGTTTGRFTLPHLQAAMLKKAVEALAAPRRTRGVEHTDPAHARGLALAAILERLPVDGLASTTSAQVVVTMEAATLAGALKASGLDTGEVVSAGAARRLACNASLMPAVLGKTLRGASRVLDLGRSSRLFNDAQRVALAVVHTHCAVSGCSRPFAWCELHHLVPWSAGGSSDLSNAVPLCHWHHRLVHDHRYQHRRLPDGSIELLRRERARSGPGGVVPGSLPSQREQWDSPGLLARRRPPGAGHRDRR